MISTLALLAASEVISVCGGTGTPEDPIRVVIETVEETAPRPVTIANTYQTIALCDRPITIAANPDMSHDAVVAIPLAKIDHAPLDAATFASEIADVSAPALWRGEKTTFEVKDGTLLVRVSKLEGPNGWVAAPPALSVTLKSGQLVILNVGGPEVVVDRTEYERSHLASRVKSLERKLSEAEATIADAKTRLANPSSIRGRYDEELAGYAADIARLEKERSEGLARAKARFDGASTIDRLGAIIHAEGNSEAMTQELVRANNDAAHARNELKSQREIAEVMREALGPNDPETLAQEALVARLESELPAKERAARESIARGLEEIRAAGKMDALYARYDEQHGGTLRQTLADLKWARDRSVDWKRLAEEERARTIAYYRSVVDGGPANLAAIRKEIDEVRATEPSAPFRIPSRHGAGFTCPAS